MSISTPEPPSIVPSMPSLDFSGGSADVVSGFPLAITVFILGILFFTELGSFIILYVLGKPIFTAYSAQGKALIQHFNTPKSAVHKTAQISGGAFQYKDIRDGTVAATSKSVLGVGNKQMVLTFANFGATIPIDVLAGVSILLNYGIKNYLDLKDKFTTPIITSINESTQTITTQSAINPSTTQQLTYKLTNDAENTLLIKGYDFENFPTLLEESKKEKLIPLTIEAVPDFVEKNINADYNEIIITYNKAANAIGKITNNPLIQLASIVFLIIVLMMLQTIIK